MLKSIGAKVSPSTFKAFKSTCESMQATPSELIRAFVDRVVADPAVAHTLVFTSVDSWEDQVHQFQREHLQTSFRQLETSNLNRQLLITIANLVFEIAGEMGMNHEPPNTLSEDAYRTARRHADLKAEKVASQIVPSEAKGAVKKAQGVTGAAGRKQRPARAPDNREAC